MSNPVIISNGGFSTTRKFKCVLQLPEVAGIFRKVPFTTDDVPSATVIFLRVDYRDKLSLCTNERDIRFGTALESDNAATGVPYNIKETTFSLLVGKSVCVAVIARDATFFTNNLDLLLGFIRVFTQNLSKRKTT